MTPLGTLATAKRLAKGVEREAKEVSKAVAKSKKDDLVDVWRVVGPDEAADIAKRGAYRVPFGGEGKYFFPTRGQAENLGQMYNRSSVPGPQTLTHGQAPRSVIDRAEGVNAGTEGPAFFIRSPDVLSICNAQCLGRIPWSLHTPPIVSFGCSHLLREGSVFQWQLPLHHFSWCSRISGIFNMKLKLEQ